MSVSLNRAGVLTSSGKTWTKKRVSDYRQRADIVAYDENLKEQEGWLTQQETATYFGNSPMSINRLIQDEIISAEGERRLPQVIRRSKLASKKSKQPGARSRGSGHRK